MSNYTERYKTMVDAKGILVAFDELLDDYRRLREDLDVRQRSRFYSRRTLGDNAVPALIPVTEQTVSNAFDMADLTGEDPDYYWLADDGTLYPVSIAGAESNATDVSTDRYFEENKHAIMRSAGDLVANGHVVGTVVFTDH